MYHILAIANDPELCDLLRQCLTPAGFLVDSVSDGEQAIPLALANGYALAVLDACLPGEPSGLDVLRRVRARSGIPILMLTGRGDDVDQILGLEMGADDCLSQPLNTRELLARIRAILRRTRGGTAEPERQSLTERITVGDLRLDTGTRIVLRGNQPVDLTSIEFSLLAVLLRDAGRVVAREALASMVLGRTLSPQDRSLDVHVCRLRKKLGCEPHGGDRIKSVRSVGYLYTLPPHPGDLGIRSVG